MLPVLGQRLRHGLALGGQDSFSTAGRWRALFLGLSSRRAASMRADSSSISRGWSVVACRTQRGLLRQRLGQQLRRLGDQRGLGLGLVPAPTAPAGSAP